MLTLLFFALIILSTAIIFIILQRAHSNRPDILLQEIIKEKEYKKLEHALTYQEIKLINNKAIPYTEELKAYTMIVAIAYHDLKAVELLVKYDVKIPDTLSFGSRRINDELRKIRDLQKQPH